MISLESFEKMYMGKKVRDGQCVALFREYVMQCYEIPHTGSVDGAVDLIQDYYNNPKMKEYFTWVHYVKDVKRGDCPIFTPTSTNKYGHIAICTAVHEDGMECIEQDGFKLDGMKPAFWTWKRFAGALRPKERT